CESESGENSNPVNITVNERPKAVVSIQPDTHVYIGEYITLGCDIQERGNTEWTYSWYKNNDMYGVNPYIGKYSWSVISSDSGDYTCRGRSNDSRISETSEALTLTVSERPEAVLSVSPQSWLTEGDSVTLNCGVTDSSTDWTFSWYTVNPNSRIRDSHGDYVYGDSYTISSVAHNHTGVYWCKARRGDLDLIFSSNLQALWITGESPPVSLTINPSRTQHFTNDSLLLSCEDQSHSTGWTVRRYTHSEGVLACSWWGSVTGSTCNIISLSTSYTGVYWCESKSGENSDPVNITVHDGDVILESPVHPLSKGHPLTLRCLDRNTNSLILRSDFYKDGSVLQTQTTGEMIIHNVSKSDEGLYHCRHSEREESEKSWVSVRGVEAPFSVLMLICSVVTASPYLLVTIILLIKRYRARVHTDGGRIENAVIEE
ncbi:Fc receptor-like protein 5, partial [Clarias gariepinus]|uniref:Fc receptor-like protein 5 n=1 Tax=Clarias gariepinus TaxID=13013 RepID=UPI00234D7E53